MSRVERLSDDVVLHLGDCRDVLPVIGRVGAIIGDPPYEKEAHRVGRRTMSNIKTGANVDLQFDAITPEVRLDVAKKATEICDGWTMFFCQAEAAGDWRDALEAAGAKYKRTMVWIKPDSSPQFNGQMPAMGYESIPLAWCGQGHSRWNGGGRRGVFTHLTNQPDRHGEHQTEKPIPLMQELVSLFTDEGAIVCDPFMGSGTTGIACIRHDRRFIGIELKEHYFDLACRRISDELKRPRLPLQAKKQVQETMQL